MPDFPYTQEHSSVKWRNFHGTIGPITIPMYCVLDVPSELGANPPHAFRRHGDALQAIIQHCVDASKPLRVVQPGWSFSSIVEPSEVAVDLGNLNQIYLVNANWLTSAYRDDSYITGRRPVFIQSGAEISHINYQLGQKNLALQTSGASDGQRIGGCIATGTHGAAIDVGAVHDTVLGLHVILGNGTGVFLHPKTNPCFTAEVAAWLESVTGVPTTDTPDDSLFHAAQVSLGSLGVVHGVILEAVPIYKLRRVVTLHDSKDQELWNALHTLETGPLHPDTQMKPYHVEVVINPYKRNRKEDAFVCLMWKDNADGERPLPEPRPKSPYPSDILSLVGQFSDSIDIPVLADVVGFRRKLTKIIRKRYPLGETPALFPGQVFGSATFPIPKGIGADTEMVVDTVDAQRAFNVIRGVLTSRAREGEHLLGVVGMRFTASTKALLGLNVKAPSCFIDLPSVRNEEALHLYQLIWEELERDGINFTCHWGKIGGFDRSRIDQYFGPDRVEEWLRAREKLLRTEVEQDVFTSPLLNKAKLV